MKATRWMDWFLKSTGLVVIAASAAISATGCTDEVSAPAPGASTWTRTAGAPATPAPATATATASATATEKYAPRKTDTAISIVSPGLSDLSSTGTAAAAAPATAPGWTRLARERLDAGDAKGALVAALEATRLGPESAGAFNALGRAELALGSLADAKAAFAKATELNPLSSHAHNNLGLVLIYQGEFESAVHELELAVSLKPVEGYMWNNLGMALEHLGRFDDARDAYREGAAIGSKLAAANLARIAARKDLTLTDELDWMVDPVPPAKDSDLAGDAGAPDEPGAPIHD